MVDIRVSEDLWRNRVAPEGVLEAWRARSGDLAVEGASVAEVRIEGALHEILAPASGRLVILMGANSLTEPGDVIGQIEPA